MPCFSLKKPYHKVDGATIRYIFDNGIDEKENDYEDYSFDLPYMFAFETFFENNLFNKDEMGFVECVGKRYYGVTARSLEGLHKDGIQFLKDKFGGNHGIKIVREAFINAIMHRDYLDNHSFTRIVLKDNCIEIYNPVKVDLIHYDILKEKFEKKDMPSYPTNPKLMRYFQLINMCERNNSGMKTLSYSDNVKMELSSDFILRTTLNFK